MIFEITKLFKFDASHQLVAVDKNQNVKISYDHYGICGTGRNPELYDEYYPHGHTYQLKITIKGPIHEDGMIINFMELKNIINNNIINKYDHTFLNKSLFEKYKKDNKFNSKYLFVTTAEQMALMFFNLIDKIIKEKYSDIELKQIELWETPTSSAIVRREDK